jgi:hypothetical protein
MPMQIYEIEKPYGDYVLYTDHLAALAEKEREIADLKEQYPASLTYCRIHRTIVMKSGGELTCCKIAALQAEANINMVEICRLRGELSKLMAAIVKRAGK